NVAGLREANSTEFDAETPHPVVALMDEQREVVDKGGTMRLGAFRCDLAEGSRAWRAYHAGEYRDFALYERHRHRYELNNDYREALSEAGMAFTGLSPDGALVEIVERPDHPWFVACQFHPEFRSRPLDPHPLFVSFISASLERSGRGS
ncbi:CTP synthase, partial [Candidatus Fermentibacterales bacterium]|nr:CTP synthase [Candidatus Fermentibacterales bacterium]